MSDLSRVYTAPSSDSVVRLVTSATLTAAATTASNILFRVTGSIEVLRLYGVVTTALGANNTAAHWRINDQTAQPVISLVTGTALSAAPVGSVIVRTSTVGVALSLKSAAAGGVLDPVAATAPAICMPFVVTQKTGGIQTDIEFRYTTTDNPTSGVIQFFLEYRPLSSDGFAIVV